MIFIASILSFAIVMLPPPKYPTLVKHSGGGGGWSIVQLDFDAAGKILNEFANSYEHPDFSCNPIQETYLPQGIIGLAKKGRIRLVCHFRTTPEMQHSIVSIATHNNECEAGGVLFEFIDEIDELVIDNIMQQPKWKLAMKFRKSW